MLSEGWGYHMLLVLVGGRMRKQRQVGQILERPQKSEVHGGFGEERGW